MSRGIHSQKGRRDSAILFVAQVYIWIGEHDNSSWTAEGESPGFFKENGSEHLATIFNIACLLFIMSLVLS